MPHYILVLLNAFILTARAECQCTNWNLVGTRTITIPKNGVQVLVDIHVERIASILESDMALTTYIYLEETYNNSYFQITSLEGADKQTVIFNPQTIIRNAKSKPTILSEETIVTPDGTVTRKIHLALTSFCPMDFHKYPFDDQHCEIDIQSFSYEASQVRYKWKNEVKCEYITSTASSTLEFVGMRSWEANATRRSLTVSCLKMKLEFQRDLKYYLSQTLLPCVMMVTTSWSVLWIDHNSMAERISVVITIVLTLSTSVISTNYNSPSTSYTKALDIFTGSCLTFLFVGIWENILVLRMSHKQKQGKTSGFYIAPEEVDRKARMILPATLFGFVAVYFAYYSVIV